MRISIDIPDEIPSEMLDKLPPLLHELTMLVIAVAALVIAYTVLRMMTRNQRGR